MIVIFNILHWVLELTLLSLTATEFIQKTYIILHLVNYFKITDINFKLLPVVEAPLTVVLMSSSMP